MKKPLLTIEWMCVYRRGGGDMITDALYSGKNVHFCVKRFELSHVMDIML